MSRIFTITSTGKTEKSFLDLRFGKCDNLVIFNQETNEYSILENPYQHSENSGVKLVRFLQNEGVTCIITGEVGPKVSKLLEQEKLQLVLLYEERIKVEEVMERLKKKS